VAVIGDAAHAMPSSLGQGAGVSMLNAVAMADKVAEAADVPAALAAWETELRPVVEHWQRRAEAVAIGRNLSDAVHPGEDLPAERPEAISLRPVSEPAL
jgi:2-methyl-3-hydroxypyridine 5-carboxylic acid dioxygenase